MIFLFHLLVASSTLIYLQKSKLIRYYLFLKLLLLSSSCCVLCYLNLQVGDSFYKALYQSINDNKCLAIKFSQWVITRLNIIYENDDPKPNWLSKFNLFFESCTIHDFKDTQNAYKQLTQRDILDDYEIDMLSVKSGSIGQVYKARHKKTNCLHAIKVKHPDLEEYMYLPRLFLNMIIKILKVLSFNKFYTPLDLNMFFRSLEEQLNFNIESSNLQTLANNFKDNYLIVVPRVINNNNDIIIMSYEEGTYFEDYEGISEYGKFKIAITYILFYHQCCYLDNFNHGDLHQGNWKVRELENKKDFCLVIYDLGLCYSFTDNKPIQKFIESWENYDMTSMGEAAYDIISSNNDVSKHPDFKEYLFKMFDDNQFKPFNLNKVLSLIYNCTRKFNLTIEYNSLNILISAGLCEQMLVKYKLMNSNITEDESERQSTKDDSYKCQTLEYINFCQSKKVFSKLEAYYKNLLKEKNINLNSLFNNLDLKLNNVSNNIDFKSNIEMVI